jgi:ABC-type sugar transport system substrate-binding protein
LDGVLGKKLRHPKDKTTFVMQRRGQHVPIGMIARDLKNRFWHRMFKGSRDAAQAVNEKGKGKESEEEGN